MVQFAVSLRDPAVADPGSGSNSFESDNDGTGSDATPFTQALFSNVSSFGPLVTPETTINANFKRAMHLRRNTKLNIYNAVFAGYATGLFIDGTATQANATAGDLKVRNTFMAGCRDFYAADFDSTFFLNADFKNDTLTSNNDLKITDPFNLEAPDFLPLSGSPVLTASSWYEDIPSAIDDLSGNNTVASAVYPNPFMGSATLSLDLESDAYVSVKIYDVTGALITLLVNERRHAGRHEFTLGIAQKGIYFAEILVNENRQVIKLVSR
jgi:hypothetical protein